MTLVVDLVGKALTTVGAVVTIEQRKPDWRDSPYLVVVIEQGREVRAYSVPDSCVTVEALARYCRLRGYRDNRPFRGSPGWTIPDAQAYDEAAEALEALQEARP